MVSESSLEVDKIQKILFTYAKSAHPTTVSAEPTPARTLIEDLATPAVLPFEVLALDPDPEGDAEEDELVDEGTESVLE